MTGNAFLERGSHPQWTELDPSLPSDSDLAPKIIARDERWRVLVRHLPERDE